MTIQTNIDLYPHTTLRMRAVANFFCIVRSREDLLEALNYSRAHAIPYIMLGGGTNIAITREVVDALVIKNVYIEKKIIKEAKDFADLMVSSGYPITKLVNEAVDLGLEGIEYHLGLPGTVGGAIYMNSKWTNPECYFGDALLSAEVIDKEGNIRTVERDYFRFAYDFSLLQNTHEVLLQAIFRMKKVEPTILRERAESAKNYRKKTQPAGTASLGCFFQNITEEEKLRAGVDTRSAGSLIDKAGLKNLQVGKFKVSEEHANFIINEGGGSPEDLGVLMKTIKEKIKNNYNIELREEVVVI